MVLNDLEWDHEAFEGLSDFLLHAHHVRKLIETSAAFVGRRVAAAEESAAAIDELAYRRNDRRIAPAAAAAPRGVGVAVVDDDVDVVGNAIV